MLAKPFNRSVAESLLRPTGINNCWVIDDRGIWPKAEWNPALGTGNRIDFEFDSWRPAVMFATDSLLQAPGDLPVLPFPFDAKDLASFMLYGFGALVADHYGDWENGPNPERIARGGQAVDSFCHSQKAKPPVNVGASPVGSSGHNCLALFSVQ